MSDYANHAEAMLKFWTENQKKMMDAQKEAFESFVNVASGLQEPADAAGMRELSESAGESVEKFNRLCQQTFESWRAMSSNWEPSSGAEGVAADTLNKILDPNTWISAGGNELGDTLRQLIEGPELADIWVTERKYLATTKEWMELRAKSNEYRIVMAKAWTRAFSTFMNRVSDGAKEGDSPKTWEQSLDLWLEIANEELIRTQRSEEFLKAQREFLRAGVDYRLKERELVEIYCETHSIPTRTEVDDLHLTVTELRREVRRLKRELARKPAKRATARRTKTKPGGAS